MSTATAGTVIALDAKKDKKIAEAIGDFKIASKEATDATNRAEKAKTTIAAFAEERWLDLFEDAGEKPPTPFKVVAPSGEAVSFVVTDKSDGAVLKADQAAELKSMLGGDIDSVVDSEIRFELDSKVLYEGTSFGATVGQRLAHRVRQMALSREITEDQAERLFKAMKVDVIRPKFLERLPLLSDRHAIELKELLRAVGSAVVRFIR